MRRRVRGAPIVEQSEQEPAEATAEDGDVRTRSRHSGGCRLRRVRGPDRHGSRHDDCGAHGAGEQLERALGIGAERVPGERKVEAGVGERAELIDDVVDRPRAGERVDELLGHEPNLTILKQLILAKTEGTPFFMEEIVQELMEQGVLRRMA